MTEANQPLLVDIDTASFDAVKHVILNSASCTWLTTNAVINSEVPASNLMTGFARTIRAERSGLALSTLVLDPTTDLSSKLVAESIAKICLAGHNDKNLERPDWEYAIRGGRIMVPRIVLEPGIKEVIATQNSHPVPEMAPSSRKLELSLSRLVFPACWIRCSSSTTSYTANLLEPMTSRLKSKHRA